MLFLEIETLGLDFTTKIGSYFYDAIYRKGKSNSNISISMNSIKTI